MSTTTGGRGRTLALAASAALLLVGAVILLWALLNQQGDPPTPQAGAGIQSQDDSGPAGAGGSPAAATTAEPAPEPGPDASAPTAGPTGEAQAAATEQPAAASTAPPEPPVEALPPSTPVSVDIPAIEVSSPLHPLGLNDDGTLQVPSGERYDQAAWYDGSPTPGEIGPSVIEGHVTSQGSTPSVFFELGALQTGDTVEVTREDGTVATFEVYATDSFPKDDFPKVAVYGNTDVPELRLITCGGEYDAQARAHVDNIVVFARMVEQA